MQGTSPVADLGDQTESRNYLFTPSQDWFSFNIETWKSLFPLVTSPSPRALEIGCWEGRSSVFLLNELCGSGGDIVCIDHFDLMGTSAGRERYRKVTHNLTLTGRKFRIMDAFSFPALMRLLGEEITSVHPGFDWIYVDGSHEADDTFLDGELAWRLARKGAVFIFDDYHWDAEPDDSIHHPKRGIDAFLSLHAGEYDRLSSTDQYQMVLQKKSDMRIGFLLEGQAQEGLDDAFGYGMNIALTVDSQYAMPAAVVIRSVLEHNKGRISFYVVDCGLSEQDKGDITRSVSIPERPDVSLLFLKLPERSFATEFGVTWGKVDMLRILPIQRVLYLDADTLVRRPLQELWSIDMKGKAIAAAVDVGFPMGHEGMARKPYFNAGVLMLDLAKVRLRLDDMDSLVRDMKEATFQDQDALNAYYDGDWLQLSLTWNAQGCGTYANAPSPERQLINLGDMKDPSIVHFTGPIHPDLASILNPWVQPYTAKPWGYVGAPGNPFSKEWWQMLEKTEWRGFEHSEGRRETRGREKERALQAAISAFETRLETEQI